MPNSIVSKPDHHYKIMYCETMYYEIMKSIMNFDTSKFTMHCPETGQCIAKPDPVFYWHVILNTYVSGFILSNTRFILSNTRQMENWGILGN